MTDEKNVPEVKTESKDASAPEAKTPALTKDVSLLFPIKVDGATIKTVTMRRPKVLDHKQAALTAGGLSQAEYEIHIFSRLCQLPVEAFDEMDYGDYSELQRTYSGFLSSRRGERSDKLS